MVLTAPNYVATANTGAYIGALNGSNIDAMIGVYQVCKNTENSGDPKGTALKHEFFIIAFASNASSRTYAMRVNSNLFVPKKFANFVGYSRTYPNLWVNSILNQYSHQIDVLMTSGSDCAKSYSHGDIPIDDEHQAYASYGQSS